MIHEPGCLYKCTLRFYGTFPQRFSSFGMESLAYINYESPKPGARLDVYGELNLRQKQPLGHRGLDTRFSVSFQDFRYFVFGI